MSVLKRFFSLACLPCLVVGTAGAQDLVIRGGTIHTLAGPDVQNGTVLVQNGRIAAVGTNVQAPAGAVEIDATGKHVYPGLFDAVTQLGLTEIGAVDVTSDLTELGTFNPHLQGLTAVHPASEHIPVARANGVTHASAAPDARTGGIGGQASLINLEGWTVEEMLVDSSVGMIVDWPSLAGGFGWFRAQTQQSFRERQRSYRQRIDSLGMWLDASRQYMHALAAGTPVKRNLRLEAMQAVVSRKVPLLINVNGEREIKDAIAFADSEMVRIVILGGREAWKVADTLAAKSIPVILGASQQTPSGSDERYDEQYAQPGVLHAAGVTFAISTFDASDSRTLPYEAGTAVPYGLPADEALRAITLYPAQILGVADRLGTIEAGKIANLIVTDGTPLEIRTTYYNVIIGGRDVGLDNKHLELYERYRARPKP